VTWCVQCPAWEAAPGLPLTFAADLLSAECQCSGILAFMLNAHEIRLKQAELDALRCAREVAATCGFDGARSCSNDVDEGTHCTAALRLTTITVQVLLILRCHIDKFADNCVSCLVHCLWRVCAALCRTATNSLKTAVSLLACRPVMGRGGHAC
jgi:hypothetical protein